MSQSKFAALFLFLALVLYGCTGAPTTSPAPAIDAPISAPAAKTTAPSIALPTAAPATVLPTELPTALTWQPTTTPTVAPNPTANPGLSFAWTRLDTPTAPPARYDHAIALDSENRQLVLFGGRAAGQVFGDTWLYDLGSNAWREIRAPGPSPRFGFASVYDPASRAVYLFGGQKEDFFNDTWKYDTVSETWSEVMTVGDKPDIRYGHGVTLDTQNNRLVISHGFARDGRHNDTWALDLRDNTWTELTPPGDKPLNRCLHDIAYASDANTVYLFGGCSSGFGPCPQGDLWALDLGTNEWTLASPAGELPSARENPSIVVDSGTGNLILFGGKADGNVNDVWLFDPSNNTWSQITTTGPGARKSHDAVFDSRENRMFLFGGSTADGATNDLWVLQSG